MLSCKSSFISMNLPVRIFSTSFLGIISRAGDRSSLPCDASPGVFWVTGGVGGGGNTADVDGDKDVDGSAIVTAGGLLVLLRWQLRGTQRAEGDHWTS